MDYVLFFLLGSFWGGSFVAIKQIVGVLPPLFCAALRVGLSLFFLSLIYTAVGRSMRVAPAHLKRAWILGLLLQGFPFALLFWAEQHVTAGLAGILNGTTPIWAFALSALFIREHEPINRKSATGLGVGLLGVALICAPHAGQGGKLTAVLSIAVVAMCYAAGTVYNRYWIRHRDTMDLYGGLFQMHVSSFLFLAVLALLVEGFPRGAGPELLGLSGVSILYLSLVSTALAWMIHFHLTRKWGAVRTSAVVFIVPIVSYVADFLFFGNVPGGLEIAGTAMLLAGMPLLR